jgi:hypothetical protein
MKKAMPEIRISPVSWSGWGEDIVSTKRKTLDIRYRRTRVKLPAIGFAVQYSPAEEA